MRMYLLRKRAKKYYSQKKQSAEMEQEQGYVAGDMDDELNFLADFCFREDLNIDDLNISDITDDSGQGNHNDKDDTSSDHSNDSDTDTGGDDNDSDYDVSNLNPTTVLE